MAAKLTEIEEARRLVLDRVVPLEAEPVALKDALGRVLAEPVTSADAVPGFDNSAMDGYAVRAADTAGADGGARLPVVDESRAGHPAQRRLAEGEAVAISTGAMVPEGADAVVRVEDTDAGSQEVEIRVEVEAGRDIRRAGEDIAAGEAVLGAGDEIGPAEAGVLVSVGRGEVACARRPRVNLLTTGDELQEPGEPLRPGAIRNSNAYSVSGLIRRSGAVLGTVEMVPDDRDATADALARALTGDVVVISGGVSVGPHDHVRPTLAALGAEEVFWGVALRPGKPTWFGVAPSGCLVFGLPGNPVSAMVTFLLFVRPAIRAMLGASPTQADRAAAVLDSDYPKQPGRAHVVRCRLELRDDGWHATPTKDQGSHVLTSMLGADALAIIPTTSGTVRAGERVEIELLG
ncbi:MAG: gephyrin-like molybdotransferase Glp [Solirubrobacterales bacterium]